MCFFVVYLQLPVTAVNVEGSSLCALVIVSGLFGKKSDRAMLEFRKRVAVAFDGAGEQCEVDVCHMRRKRLRES